MEKVGFIGGYDKIDLMIYTAKILTAMGKRIIILDTTQKQKSRYIVPAINPTVSYVTEFEGIDIAVGFRDFEAVKKYLGTENELRYDIALIDIDSSRAIVDTGLTIADKVYFATAFDLYSLKRGIGAIENIENPLKLTKIYFTKTFSKEEDDYLNFLSLGKKVIWNENIIYFPIESGDDLAIAENQRLGKVKFGNLTIDYKEGVASLASEIAGEKIKVARNIIKNLE